jgi:hypothetical protein
MARDAASQTADGVGRNIGDCRCRGSAVNFAHHVGQHPRSKPMQHFVRNAASCSRLLTNMRTNTSSIAVSALGRIEIHLSFIASGPPPRIGDTDTDDPDAGAGEVCKPADSPMGGFCLTRSTSSD